MSTDFYLCVTSELELSYPRVNAQGAQNAGFLATVWVNVYNLEEVPAGGATPDHTISNIGELPALLKALDLDLGQ